MEIKIEPLASSEITIHLFYEDSEPHYSPFPHMQCLCVAFLETE